MTENKEDLEDAGKSAAELKDAIQELSFIENRAFFAKYIKLAKDGKCEQSCKLQRAISIKTDNVISDNRLLCVQYSE